MLVKICGIRIGTDAKIAIDAGADFLGFNFVLNSQRYINPANAKKIIDQTVGCDILKVGVFQDEKLEIVNQITKDLKLDFIQLHGNENPDYCAKIETDLIKVFTLFDDFDVTKVINEMKKYSPYVSYFMIDKKKDTKSRQLNLKKSKQIASLFPLIFAGGLNATNIKNVITIVNPLAVDVASGIETNGIHDAIKIKSFIRNAKEIL